MGNEKISESGTSMGEVSADGAEDYWTWRIGLQELARDEEREVSARCEAAASLLDEARTSLATDDFDERREALDKARAADAHPALVPGLLEFVVAGLGGGAEWDARGQVPALEQRRPAEAPSSAPLPIFEEATSTLYRSNDGGLEVLPIQYGYGKPTFEVRHDGEAVLCTHDRVLADAYVAGYDLAADATKELLSALKPQRVDTSQRISRAATLDPACTGYVDEQGYLAHDGDTCPVHEPGLDIGDGDPGDLDAEGHRAFARAYRADGDHAAADLHEAEAREVREPSFAVVLAVTGDRATAETAEGALRAAATMIDDVVRARGGAQGLVRSLRESVYVTENGTYAGILTAFARRGERSI